MIYSFGIFAAIKNTFPIIFDLELSSYLFNIILNWGFIIIVLFCMAYFALLTNKLYKLQKELESKIGFAPKKGDIDYIFISNILLLIINILGFMIMIVTSPYLYPNNNFQSFLRIVFIFSLIISFVINLGIILNRSKSVTFSKKLLKMNLQKNIS